MNQWAFIVAAYGLTLCGLGSFLVHSWHVMRRAETKATEIVGTP